MSKIYIKNPDFVQREIAGEFILIPIKRNLKDANNLFVLNEMGAQVWKRIDGTASVQKISQNLLEEFETSPEILEKDLKTLLTDLESIQAIQLKSE